MVRLYRMWWCLSTVYPDDGLPFAFLFCTDMPIATPALHLAPELLLKAQGIRAVFFQQHGTLATGCCYPSGNSEASSRYDRQDMTGLQMLLKMGYLPAVIFERSEASVACSLATAGVETVIANSGEDCVRAAEDLLKAKGLSWQQTAVMGYDWQDLSLMCRAAFTAAPADAHLEVRAQAHYVSPATAGHGAARSLCDVLLVANGCYARLLKEYLV